VNNQNDRYGVPKMTHIVHEVPLHDLKIKFRFAARPHEIIWPVLFKETINNY